MSTWQVCPGLPYFASSEMALQLEIATKEEMNLLNHNPHCERNASQKIPKTANTLRPD